MSVLNQSGEEQVECPLCMEPLEVDDLNFFPCTCGYQICRFCWHRIRLDENGGLCPACRKAYSENPADFIPLSREQVAKLKAEKRQRNQQRKALLSESRKHLASVRVVQRNLVFVVGLPPRLADPEILKRHEYFGKFGKIHKVVINQSTSYAGSQGPSASAYVTYLKSDDALRAIQAVNNVTIDNRVIKSSLGTTKYCSHFMKNQPCPKSDCMYLHEYGDSEASFTREQMHLGKHTEYEKKLHDDLLVRTKQQTGQLAAATDVNNKILTAQKAKEGNGSGALITNSNGNGNTNKENWPQLDKDNNKKVEKDKVRKGKTKNAILETSIKGKDKKDIVNKLDTKSSSQESITNSSSSSSENTIKDGKELSDSYTSSASSIEPSPSSSPKSSHSPILLLNRSSTPSSEPLSANCSHLNSFSSNNNGSSTYINKLPPNLMVNVGRSEDNNSYFSSSGFNKLHQVLDNNIILDKDELLTRTRLGGEIINEKHLLDSLAEEHGQMLTDSLPNINTTEDWAAAFGFTGQQQQHSREHELLQQQHQKIHQQNNSKFSSNYNEFLPLVEPNNSDCGYGKGMESFNGFYEMSKLQENLMANKRNGLISRQQQDSLTTQQSHISNGIMDHNMSKFFSDFNKFNAKESSTVNSSSLYQNGFNNGLHNSYNLLQQQQQQKHQYEEQYRNLTMKQSNFSGGQTTIYQNGIQSNPSSYTNGDISLLNNGSAHNNLLYSKPSMLQTQNLKNNSEAELDFDPFQETQKALAELMANEQHRKIHNPGRSSQINGLIHSNQNNTHHIPPPPPGFLQQQQQQQAHMNSFGSKILPFLSLTNSQQQQQQINNNWSNNYQMPPPQQKNLTNSTCNDWKVLDPAILSSSRSYQLPQIPAGNIRDPYMVQQQQQNGQIRPSSSSFDYQQIGGGIIGNNNPFSAFTQQLQQPNNNFNNSFNNLNTTSVTTTPSSSSSSSSNVNNNLNWFAAANDLNSQISSPPGFRNSQTSKQQEC